MQRSLGTFLLGVTRMLAAAAARLENGTFSALLMLNAAIRGRRAADLAVDLAVCLEHLHAAICCGWGYSTTPYCKVASLIE